MAGYTRNDTGNNIADGNVINASDLDGEFDAVEAAFNNSTGHTHDGTSAEGAPIEVAGPAQDLVITATEVRPKTDNTLDLGTNTLEFKDLYLDGTANIDSLVADTADINAGSIDGVTLGTNSAVTSAVITTADINGGTIDSTTIGGSTPAAGSFTTITGSGDMAIDTDTLFVDASADSVGIGTSSPSSFLEVVGSGVVDSTIARIKGGSAAGNRGIEISNDSVGNVEIQAIRATDNTTGFQLSLNPDGGNVGIGTSSPSQKFHVEDVTTANTSTYIQVVSGNNGNAGITFGDSDEDLRGGILYNNASDALRFFKSGFTEAGRFDSSGNLLVGKTTNLIGTAGHTLWNDGLTDHTRSGEVLRVNRLSTDGDIITFRKDSSTIGSIGTNGGRAFITGTNGSNGCGLRFTTADIRPTNLNGNDSDNFVDLGDSGTRFDDIYATNGTIQTSDRNEKQDIEELSEAEQRVAVACKGLLRKFRWKSAVEKKGDDARIHFGIIAQDLQAAFEAEGLDAHRYAMFISTTWWEAEETYTDDEGVEQTRIKTYDTAEEAPEGAVERTRLGVRYSELLAFIIAAI